MAFDVNGGEQHIVASGVHVHLTLFVAICNGLVISFVVPITFVP